MGHQIGPLHREDEDGDHAEGRQNRTDQRCADGDAANQDQKHGHQTRQRQQQPGRMPDAVVAHGPLAPGSSEGGL